MAVADPRDAGRLGCLQRLEQRGQAAFLLQTDRAEVGLDADVVPGAEQLLEDRLGGEALESERQVEGQQAIEVVGKDGHGEDELRLRQRGQSPAGWAALLGVRRAATGRPQSLRLDAELPRGLRPQRLEPWLPWSMDAAREQSLSQAPRARPPDESKPAPASAEDSPPQQPAPLALAA